MKKKHKCKIIEKIRLKRYCDKHEKEGWEKLRNVYREMEKNKK